MLDVMATPDQTGPTLRLRRTRLGASQDDVAAEAHVNRDTVGAAERGQASPKSTRRIEEALARMEDESGLKAAAPRGYVEDEHGGIVRIRLEGVFGATSAIVEAPADNPDALAAALDLILRRMQQGEGS